MGRWTSHLKYLVLFSLDMIPPVVRLICYDHVGTLTMYVLWPCLLVLTVLNFRFLRSTTVFVSFQSIMALCAVISGVIATELYCMLVSNDPMSHGLGIGMSIAEAIILMVLTVILAVMKLLIKRSKLKKV